ncbi:MAG: DUF1294 domain-containing protein [Dysgonamonadaceae bacterium]|jgi:uncharacterized membrane protein YsdA (DUF1294 family)|nr:DUF1294 domain-containing protein [Dysgonamonadaceae bacterium]
MNATIISLLYFVIINLISFSFFGIDKRLARKKKTRTSEKMLFLIAIAGGAFGTWIGMYFFRHKTKRWYFVVFIPLILLAQVAGVYYFVLYK